MDKTKNNTQRKRYNKTNRSKKKKGSGSIVGWIHRIPWWSVWIGGILIACAYVFVFYYFFVSPTSFRWRALYGEPNYPEGYDIRGIDISHYQENVDWARLRNAQVGDVPIRFVISKATEGEKMIDENFSDNFYRARENELIRGAYHYYIPSIDPVKQAKFYLKQVHLEPGDLPPILDIEDRGSKPLSQFQKDVKKWLDTVEAEVGCKPIIYTGYKFMVDYLSTDDTFKKYPYWIAHYYVKELTYTGDWIMWQYTDCGHVNGIKGYVDFDIFNGSMTDLLNLTIPEPDIEELMDGESVEE